jgi:hypothetical protein
VLEDGEGGGGDFFGENDLQNGSVGASGAASLV